MLHKANHGITPVERIGTSEHILDAKLGGPLIDRTSVLGNCLASGRTSGSSSGSGSVTTNHGRIIVTSSDSIIAVVDAG